MFGPSIMSHRVSLLGSWVYLYFHPGIPLVEFGPRPVRAVCLVRDERVVRDFFVQLFDRLGSCAWPGRDVKSTRLQARLSARQVWWRSRRWTDEGLRAEVFGRVGRTVPRRGHGRHRFGPACRKGKPPTTRIDFVAEWWRWGLSRGARSGMGAPRVISSVVERFVHIEDVRSSNLLSPTISAGSRVREAPRPAVARCPARFGGGGGPFAVRPRPAIGFDFTSRDRASRARPDRLSAPGGRPDARRNRWDGSWMPA